MALEVTFGDEEFVAARLLTRKRTFTSLQYKELYMDAKVSL
jgi:hypothetical protein